MRENVGPLQKQWETAVREEIVQGPGEEGLFPRDV